MRKKYIILFAVALLALLPLITWAQTPVLHGISEKCLENGTCNTNDVMLLIKAVMNYGIAICGAVALLMYVIGGTWMLFAAGNQTRIERGKSIVVGTSVALIFILGSWLIVDFTLRALSVKDYRLTTGKCGDNPQCGAYQQCVNNERCADLCEADIAKNDPAHKWGCSDYGDENECGIVTYEECDKKPNCKKFKCQAPKAVCCYKPEA